jgi:hypothetical protein
MKVQIEKTELLPDPAHQNLMKELLRNLIVILIIWRLSGVVIYSSKTTSIVERPMPPL